MKITTLDTPEPTDSACKEKTGKTRAQWFAVLDGFGGLELGRRALVQRLHEAVGKDAWWSTTLVVEYERARGQKEKGGKPTGYAICSTKTIAAPLERVFRAFSDPKVLDRWLGSRTSIEFTDGGRFENGEGDRGTFERIRENKDIRFSWDSSELASGTAVEVLFADKGKSKTGVTLNHKRIQSRREADRLREGWSNALASLKTLLED